MDVMHLRLADSLKGEDSYSTPIAAHVVASLQTRSDVVVASASIHCVPHVHVVCARHMRSDVAVLRVTCHSVAVQTRASVHARSDVVVGAVDA